MQDQIELLIDEAINASEYMDAFLEREDGDWELQCLEGRLYLLVEKRPDRDALLFTASIKVPEGKRAPLAALMYFNALIDENDGIFTAAEPQNPVITARRYLSTHNLRAEDIARVAEAFCAHVFLLHAMVHEGEEHDDETDTEEVAANPIQDTESFAIFRG